MGQSTTDAPPPIRALIADDHLVVRRKSALSARRCHDLARRLHWVGQAQD
jgi:hypothetical protein